MTVAAARETLGLQSLRVVADAEVRLAAATLTRSDGSQEHRVVDSDDLRRVAQRLNEIAEKQEQVDLAEALSEALGELPLS